MVLALKRTYQPMQETQVRSLGGEDPLEEGMETPLQHSCLKNLMDRGAWRAVVHRVAKSQTPLKQLSTQACMIATLNFFSARMPIFTSLSSFFFFSPLHLVLLRFNLVPSSGACSSGISFCPSCCLYFYASGI